MSSPRDADPAELRRCLRDVLGLLALPAVWRARPPAEILRSFAEALDATVTADVLFASAHSEGEPVVVARIRGDDAGGRLEEASRWFSPLASRKSSEVVKAQCGDLGALTAVYEPIAYHAAQGYVVVASGRPGFPTESELAVIRAATALATTSIETSRALLEREIALRAKDEFLAVLGHELRNPLAPIATALEIICARKQGRLSREEEVIRKQVRHLGRLVDDLLDVARITRGTVELDRAPVELAEIVGGAVEATEGLFRNRRHSLDVRVPRRGLVVHGDPFRLTQVFVNLLVNAAKYSPDGGRVEVRAAVREGRVVVSVLDRGIGIAPELLPRVFEPFVQGRRPSDAQYGGLGIGLALVRTLVTMHGGTVSASSDGPGLGSRLDVELPLASGPAEIEAEAVGAPPGLAGSAGRRVLVVDDNEDAGEMLGEALKLFGHEVRVLHDPVAAADVVEAFAPDVVVLDIGMPVLDGYGVAAQIRSRGRGRKPLLLALTGYGQASDRERTRAAGFDDHFVKPVDLAMLVARIAELRGA